MYADVVRVVAVAGSFESVSAAAAAAVVYVVVVVVVVVIPACSTKYKIQIHTRY